MARLPCSITNPRIALAVMAFYTLAQGALNTLLPSMITSLEKRFDLTSAKVGWLLAANDIGYVSCIVIIAYFGGKGNEVKALVGSALGLAFSGFILGLPFLIYGPKYTVEEIMSTGNASVQGQVNLEVGESAVLSRVCDANASSSSANKTVTGDGFSGKEVSAFVIQMIGGVINGIAASPFWNIGLSFLDSMAGANSGGFIGALLTVRAISPLIGFSLGSALNTIHETLEMRSYDYPGGQRDPYWISAWWIGFFILGAGVLSTAPFLSMLKRKPWGKSEQLKVLKVNVTEDGDTEGHYVSKEMEDDEKEAHGDIQPGILAKYSLSELVQVLKKLCSNPVYIFLIIGNVFEFFSLIGLFSFFPKMLEFNFRVEASKASTFSAIALSGSAIAALTTSGIVSHFFPMSLRKLNFYHAAVNLVSELLFPLLFIFQCDTVPVIGQDFRSPNLTCAPEGCECPVKYKPVCAGGNSYYTACHAGCMSYSTNTSMYSDCLCNGSTATQGVCESMCEYVYPYIAIFFIVKMIGSLAVVQFVHIMLKLTTKEFKAIGLATVGFIFGILGFILPPLSGMIMDTTCILRNPVTSGSSFCLMYDTKKLGNLLHGIAFGVMMPGCICFFISWYLTEDDEQIQDDKSNVSEEDGDKTIEKQRQQEV